MAERGKDEMDASGQLRALFNAAVAAADPALRVPDHLPPRPSGRVIVVGAGKASGAMAKAVEDHWQGPLEGLVITRYDHKLPCDRIEVVEAAHPVPDRAGREAAQRLIGLVSGLGEDDLVLCLISGGGSALMAAPAPGMTLDDKQNVNRQLLSSGATISEMNCLRKHLSAVKGGRIAAAAHPAKVVTLLISDVPGDDPATIASGPTVPDPTTRQDALEIVARYGLELSPAVRSFLESSEAETPKPGDPRLAGGKVAMIATPQMSLDAAAACGEEAGFAVSQLGDAIEGEAREVGAEHARLALDVASGRGTVAPPAALLSGGETTVTMKGSGRGGRNAEYALALAIALDGAPGIHAIACDTDGIDGTEDNAGAIVTPDTLERARAKDMDARAYLDNNDAYSFFEALGDLVVTGPTLTNVNDFRAILIQ